MICPACGSEAIVANVYDRDTNITRRRYVCASCVPPVVIKTKEIVISFGKVNRHCTIRKK